LLYYADDFIPYTCEAVAYFVLEDIDTLDEEGPSIIYALNKVKIES
jgi:hypothetical protein